MALSTYLTKADFYANSSGITSADVNDAYVESLVEKVNAALSKKLKKLFELTADQTGEYKPKHASRIIACGTWQRTPTLLVKRGTYGQSGLTTLAYGSEYTFFTANGSEFDPGFEYPAIGLKLASSLSDNQYITITGTYGYSNGVPEDKFLDLQLYDLIKSLVLAGQNETDSGGKGLVSRVKMDKVDTTFAAPSESGPRTTKELFECLQNIFDSLLAEYDFSDVLPYTIG
jgi:hypothetical protein